MCNSIIQNDETTSLNKKDSAQIYFKSGTKLSPAPMDFKCQQTQKLNVNEFLDFSPFKKKTGNPTYISNTLVLHSSVMGALGPRRHKFGCSL